MVLIIVLEKTNKEGRRRYMNCNLECGFGVCLLHVKAL
jgi:hypothetical protein